MIKVIYKRGDEVETDVIDINITNEDLNQLIHTEGDSVFIRIGKALYSVKDIIKIQA